MDLIIFGGTFNPVHIGHRIIAELAYDFIKPEIFLIIPAYKPPHRLNEIIAPFDKRLDWIKKVFPDSRFKISDVESKLEPPSYTLRTLKYIKKEYPEHNIYLLIGYDSLVNFQKWYRWKEIIQIVRLLVYPRMMENNIKKVPSELDGTYLLLDTPLIDISASYIRQRIKEGRSIYGLVDDKIVKEVENFYKDIL